MYTLHSVRGWCLHGGDLAEARTPYCITAIVRNSKKDKNKKSEEYSSNS